MCKESGNGTKLSKRTLCETCQKATCALGGCNWSNYLKPVDGWKAIPSKILSGKDEFGNLRYTESYHIVSCPEYLADIPRAQIPALLTNDQNEKFLKDPKGFLAQYEHYIYTPRPRKGTQVSK